MKKPNRPWKKFARIDCVTYNSGESKFEPKQIASITGSGKVQYIIPQRIGEQPCESLAAAEAVLGAWFEDWWVNQVRSVKPA